MTAEYTVYYFISPSGDNPVNQFLDSLSELQQSKVLRLLQYIRTYGLSAILPHTKKLTGTPLWEIRILGKNNIRVLYAVPQQNLVLILHGFIKKSQKTPLKEIHVALTRYEQWKNYKALVDK